MTTSDSGLSGRFRVVDLISSTSILVSLTRMLVFGAVAFGIVFNLTVYVQGFSYIQQLQTQKLLPSEIALAQSSKSAIIGTGISASYFDKHFRLERVIDKEADRRVTWTYSIGEYEATLSDAVGFYTDEKGRRVNLHAIRDSLGKAHEIKSTISRKRAEQLMSKCLGNYIPGAVVFQAFGARLRAALLFTASSIPKQPENSRDKGKPLIHTGFLNLETGKCTKGIAQAGRPRFMDR